MLFKHPQTFSIGFWSELCSVHSSLWISDIQMNYERDLDLWDLQLSTKYMNSSNLPQFVIYKKYEILFWHFLILFLLQFLFDYN